MSDDVYLPSGPAPAPAVQFTRGAKTGDTVTVACKLPHGVILRIFDWEDYDEPMRDGSMARRRRSRPIEDQQFVVRGTWAGSAGQAYNAQNIAVAELLPGGYALTHGCPKELWDKWYDQNRKSLLVTNKIVFAHADHTTVNKEARDLRSVTSGLEPLDAKNPSARMPGGTGHRAVRIGVLEQDEGTSPR
jgi:hypothetical protein